MNKKKQQQQSLFGKLCPWSFKTTLKLNESKMKYENIVFSSFDLVKPVRCTITYQL